MKTNLYAIYLGVLFFVSCQKETVNADLLLTNALIWTGNATHPKAEAMAIKGDSILAIGSFHDLKKIKDVAVLKTYVGGKLVFGKH